MQRNLRKEMEAYSNTRILNNLKQKDFFSSESVSMAREIAIQRNLIQSDQYQSTPPPFRPQMLTATAAPAATKAAIRTGYAESREKKSSGGASTLTIILIVLFVVKTILRLATMN